MKTVRQVTHNILRRNNIRIIFGNLGSNERPFLQNFPDHFEYKLGLAPIHRDSRLNLMGDFRFPRCHIDTYFQADPRRINTGGNITLCS